MEGGIETENEAMEKLQSKLLQNAIHKQLCVNT